MEITAVKDTAKTSLTDFFRRNKQIGLSDAYVCRVNNEIIGCYSLQKVATNIFCLDQLYK